MSNEYLVGREPLTREEEFILRKISQVGNPIREYYFHMIMNLLVTAFRSSLYQFEPKRWEDIDESYETGLGHVLYSARLHNVIDSLVRKHYLARNSESPLVINLT